MSYGVAEVGGASPIPPPPPLKRGAHGAQPQYGAVTVPDPSPSKTVEERNSAFPCQRRWHREEGSPGTQRDSAVGRCCPRGTQPLLSLHQLVRRLLPPHRHSLPTGPLRPLSPHLAFSFEAETEMLVRGRPSLFPRGKTLKAKGRELLGAQRGSPWAPMVPTPSWCSQCSKPRDGEGRQDLGNLRARLLPLAE